MARQYETVIGLEVHIELSTETKIFCGCSAKFGGAPIPVRYVPGCLVLSRSSMKRWWSMH